MDDLLREFLTESNESLSALDMELVQLEQNPNDDSLLGNIFRLVHTIKGTCGFLGLPRLEAVAHAAENVLGRIRDGELTVTPESISLILESLDAIKYLLACLEETEAEPEGDDRNLIDRLNAVAEGKAPIAGSAFGGNEEDERFETSVSPDFPDGGRDGAGVSPSGPVSAPALIDRLGGPEGVSRAVEIFYGKVLADERLAPFFEGADLGRLRAMQQAFLTMALGGDQAYEGRNLREAHASLVARGLNDGHFDRVMTALRQTLEDLGADEDLMIDVLTVAESTRSEVLGLSDHVPAEAERQRETMPREATQVPSPSAPKGGLAIHGDGPVEGPGQESQEPRESAIANQSIRINVSLVENLMNLVSELVLTRNSLLQMVRDQGENELHVPLQRLSQTTSELQEGIMKTRMQPIGNAWNKLPRIVRDLSIDLGKKIDLRMKGADTELDRQVLELIKDPLTHMVRNSADHGIESPKERVAAGKPQTGVISLDAYHQGGHIIILIADDGRGIDVAKVRAKAVKNGLASEAELAGLSDQQVQQFIFRAGFSTAEQVTNVSGRGVGMDVVRTNIERIGGTIELKSTQGKGSVFVIKIPLTLAIVSALIVGCAGQRFAMPQISLVELVRASETGQNRIETINGSPVMRLRDRLLPLVNLRRLLGLGDDAEEQGKSSGSESGNLILVTTVGSMRFGIIVDRVFDTEEIVVKPVAPLLRDIPLYSGNTILGDGSVVMILDPNGIASTVGNITLTEEEFGEAVHARSRSGEDKETMLVFRAGDTSPKAVPLSLVARLEEIPVSEIEVSDGLPVVQYRGQLMPLILVSSRASMRTEGHQPVVVFMDDEQSMGLVVDEIVDIVEDRLKIEFTGAGDGLLGSAVIDGRATDVIDAGYYVGQLARLRKAPKPQSRPGTARAQRVLLIDDSAFFRNLLTPLLSVAGYAVTTVGAGEDALRLRENGEMFDLIISDIQMPGMDGFTLAQNIRADDRWKQTPLVALSSRTNAGDLDRGRAVGFDDYVAKFDREAILNTLQDTLASTRSAA